MKTYPQKTAIFPGSFDAITLGHVRTIESMAKTFPHLIVGMGTNKSKSYIFSLAERELLARRALSHLKNVSVTSYSGMIVDYMVRNGLKFLVRGLRNVNDFTVALTQDDYGLSQNRLSSQITVLYSPSLEAFRRVSSSSVKNLIEHAGYAYNEAPLSTIHAVQARKMGQYFYGITGIDGGGKSWLCKQFVVLGKQRGIPVVHIELDRLFNGIIGHESEPLFQDIRKQIAETFGSRLKQPDGSINRQALGRILYESPHKRRVLNDLIHDTLLLRAKDMFMSQKGLFLLDGSMLAETNKLFLCHNNVLLVDATRETLKHNLSTFEGLTSEQIERRLKSPSTTLVKETMIREAQTAERYGTLHRFKACHGTSTDMVEQAFEDMLETVDLFGELRITAFLKQVQAYNPAEAYKEVVGFYNDNDRLQHNLFHIVSGLRPLKDSMRDLADPDATVLAWLLHDSAYNAQSQTNEEDSVEVMHNFVRKWGISPSLTDRSGPIILSSKHGVIPPETEDQRIMHDIDMLLFAQSRKDYIQTAQNMRREYGWATDESWRKGRREFLQWLDRTGIYITAPFQRKYDRQARSNIAWECKTLTKS
ncbi:MAG: pantetheine-phosphate adenylyltransferase [Alphaproteobacteria bacterium]|jgi:pantetheine-phosphate adenylyltransferase|nr:pantetheine-phosphate adenylyltransferase [Alphaproteobacteria bacterium]